MNAFLENNKSNMDELIKMALLEKARRIIDAISDGKKIPRHEVTWALKLTGDIEV